MVGEGQRSKKGNGPPITADWERERESRAKGQSLLLRTTILQNRVFLTRSHSNTLITA